MEAYGFEQSQTEYTLEMFGQKADSFKENHFKMAPQVVGEGGGEVKGCGCRGTLGCWRGKGDGCRGGGTKGCCCVMG